LQAVHAGQPAIRPGVHLVQQRQAVVGRNAERRFAFPPLQEPTTIRRAEREREHVAQVGPQLQRPHRPFR